MTRRILIAVLVSVVGVCSADERWIEVPAKDPLRSFFIDRQSLLWRDGAVDYWEVEFFNTLIPKDAMSGRAIKEKRMRRRIDCGAREQQSLQGALFDEHRSLIEMTATNEAEAPRLPILPDTVADQEWTLLCEPKGFTRGS